MKKFLILIIVLLFSTGCSSYTELNDLSIVNTLGIDYRNNKYYITLSVIENNDNKIKIYSSNNKNIDKAINNIYLSSNKKLYLSHLDLLILTDNSINNKIKNILSYFLKNNEYRNNFQVILMNSNDMNNFFINKYKSDDINNLIDINSNETSIVYKKELESFFKDLLIDNNSYLPTITYNNFLKLNGYTLITNNKIDKHLSNTESILFNILSKHSKYAYLNNIKIYDSDIRIKLKKNNISYKIYLTTNTNNKDKVKELENSIIQFLNKYRYQDILKIRDTIRKNNYNYYKKNKDVLKKLKFNVKIVNKMQKDYIKGDYYENK